MGRIVLANHDLMSKSDILSKNREALFEREREIHMGFCEEEAENGRAARDVYAGDQSLYHPKVQSEVVVAAAEAEKKGAVDTGISHVRRSGARDRAARRKQAVASALGHGSVPAAAAAAAAPEVESSSVPSTPSKRSGKKMQKQKQKQKQGSAVAVAVPAQPPSSPVKPGRTKSALSQALSSLAGY